jgi:hypothetical protein
MRRLTALAVLILLAPGSVARAANVDVELFCSACCAGPDPVILDVGDTVTFTCHAEACAASECIVFDNGGSISGITPFAQFISPGETGSPLGPATAAGEYAVVFVVNDLCYPSFYLVMETAAAVPTVTPPGAVAVAMLMLIAGFAGLRLRRLRGKTA